MDEPGLSPECPQVAAEPQARAGHGAPHIFAFPGCFWCICWFLCHRGAAGTQFGPFPIPGLLSPPPGEGAEPWSPGCETTRARIWGKAIPVRLEFFLFVLNCEAVVQLLGFFFAIFSSSSDGFPTSSPRGSTEGLTTGGALGWGFFVLFCSHTQNVELLEEPAWSSFS